MRITVPWRSHYINWEWVLGPVLPLIKRSSVIWNGWHKLLRLRLCVSRIRNGQYFRLWLENNQCDPGSLLSSHLIPVNRSIARLSIYICTAYCWFFANTHKVVGCWYWVHKILMLASTWNSIINVRQHLTDKIIL